MNHIHLNSTPSTQDYILENFKKHEEGILVSTDSQTKGKGQYERSWIHFEGALAFSFTLKPNEMITLSSLEIPIILKKYFLNKFKSTVKFKWPNDLMSAQGKKFGGILLNRQGNDDLIIGVGLNLWPIEEEEEFLFKACGLFEEKIAFDPKKIALEIYTFILENRLNPIQVIKEWNDDCIHLNKEVKIQDNNKTYTGIFKGIGKNGQALIQNEEEQLEIYTGSLFF